MKKNCRYVWYPKVQVIVIVMYSRHAVSGAIDELGSFRTNGKSEMVILFLAVFDEVLLSS